MYTLKNPTKTDSWFVDLHDHSQVENDLPQNSFIVRNDSNIIIYVELYGIKVGEVQRYSSDTFSGRDFKDFKLYNPDGNQFEANDLFVQMSKGQMMTSQPFNPQWDMMEDDLDNYSAGCDSRISLSAAITLVILKYWLNVQNGLIVQRRLNVQGSAAMGTYDIDFEGDIINGNCGINATVLEIQKIRKTLSASGLDFSDTDCTINGLMFDYKKNSNDISDDFTLVTGNANGYDNDLSTYVTGSTNSNPGGVDTIWYTFFEVSFDSMSIAHTHAVVNSDAASGRTSYIQVQLNVNSVWTTVFSHSYSSGVSPKYYDHSLTDYDLVTGARVQVKSSEDGYSANGQCYDLSLVVQ